METEAPASVETPVAPTPSAAVPTGEQDVQGESSTPPADAKAEEPPKRKGGGFQKRIDKLTRQVYELTAQIEANKGVKPAALDEKEPKRDDFDDLESYQRSLAEHTAKRVFREHIRSEEESRRQSQVRDVQQKRIQAWEKHAEAAADKYDDGEDVIAHFASTVELSNQAMDAILESDVGHEIMHYLGKHDADVARISKLTPARQASEIGKLEVKLSEAPKKQSSAPAPIDPVKGKGAAETGLSDDLPIKEWIKRRSKQVRSR